MSSSHVRTGMPMTFTPMASNISRWLSTRLLSKGHIGECASGCRLGILYLDGALTLKPEFRPVGFDRSVMQTAGCRIPAALLRFRSEQCRVACLDSFNTEAGRIAAAGSRASTSAGAKHLMAINAPVVYEDAHFWWRSLVRGPLTPTMRLRNPFRPKPASPAFGAGRIIPEVTAM